MTCRKNGHHRGPCTSRCDPEIAPRPKPDKGPIIAYRLEPVYALEPGSIATAAVMQCMITGKILSGMGGGGMFIHPAVVSALASKMFRIEGLDQLVEGV